MSKFAALSKAERRTMIGDIDFILDYIDINIVKRAKSEDDYAARKRRLEARINKILADAWDDKSREAAARARELLSYIDMTASTAAVIADSLEYIMSQALISVVVDDKLVDHIHYAYDMAGKRVARKLKLPYFLTIVDVQAKNWLARDMVYWVGQFYNNHIKEAVTKTVIHYAIEEGQNAWTTGQRIKDVLAGTCKIPPAYMPKSYIRAEAYWQGLAANAITRGTIFGGIEPMVQAGVTEYEILTAEDERVCPICRPMHGRKFSIEQAVRLRDKVLGAETPDDIRSIHPWPKVAEATNWSNNKLAEAGMSLPPFHFHCRCDIVATKFKRY